ncbi:MAG: hypothetical protein U9R28_05980, partial [Pseudomonadota bacterium]|nr:hypothetical protein [Pseudomonadota bacterium]
SACPLERGVFYTITNFAQPLIASFLHFYDSFFDFSPKHPFLPTLRIGYPQGYSHYTLLTP